MKHEKTRAPQPAAASQIEPQTSGVAATRGLTNSAIAVAATQARRERSRNPPATESAVQFLATGEHDHNHDHDHDHDEPTEVGSGLVTSTRFAADAELAAVAEGKKTLATGATGVATLKIQQALVDLGLLTNDKVTGVIDAATSAALSAYQASVGVGATGEVDKATFEALDKKFADHSVEGAALAKLTPSRSPTPGKPYDVGAAPPELMEGTRSLSNAERDGFNDAISTGVKADANSGKLPTFVETVDGETYGARVEAEILRIVGKYLKKAKAASIDRKDGHSYDWGDINNVGVESKKATDDSFGDYATGAPLSGGKVTSKIQDAWTTKEKELAADPAVAEKWAEWRIRKIITGGSAIRKVDEKHGAVQTRAVEAAILGAIKRKIAAARKDDLVLIHKNWSAFASGGRVNVQTIKDVDDHGDFDKADGRAYMWKLFQTLIHEYLHTLEHPEHRAYRGGLKASEGGFTLREGTTDYFTKVAYNNTAITPGLRKTVEGPFHDAKNEHPIAKLRSYRQSANAEQGAAIIGLPNLCAGFFLGEVDLIGKT